MMKLQSREQQELAATTRSWEEAQDFFVEFQREHDLAGALISDFYPPEQ